MVEFGLDTAHRAHFEGRRKIVRDPAPGAQFETFALLTVAIGAKLPTGFGLFRAFGNDSSAQLRFKLLRALGVRFQFGALFVGKLVQS